MAEAAKIRRAFHNCERATWEARKRQPEMSGGVSRIRYFRSLRRTVV